MIIQKQNNQYYSSYSEENLCNYINSNYDISKCSFINSTGFNFPEADIKELNEDVYTCGNLIKNKFHFNKAVWCGKQTMLSDCDMIVNDDIHVELKFINGEGSGTYYNGSLSGFFDGPLSINFKEIYKPYYVSLGQLLGQPVSLENNSPVDFAMSKQIRANETLYKKIQNMEKPYRAEYLKAILDIIEKNADKRAEIYFAALNKGNKNSIPQMILCFNRKNKTLKNFSIDSLKQNPINLRSTKTGFILGDLRFQLGWQNGTGLANPSVRIFIQGQGII